MAYLLSALDPGIGKLLQQVQLWVALELFRQRKISAGRASELAAISLSEFMDLTRQHGVEWVSYTDDELRVEIREAISLGGTANWE